MKLIVNVATKSGTWFCMTMFSEISAESTLQYFFARSSYISDQVQISCCCFRNHLLLV